MIVCVQGVVDSTSAQVVYCSVTVNLVLLRLFARTYWHAPGWRNILPSNVVTNTSPTTEHSAKKTEVVKWNFIHRFLIGKSERINTPVQLFSVQFQTPPMQMLKEEQQHIGNTTFHVTMVYMSTLTKHYNPVEGHVPVHMMYHGKHKDTEKQRCMFHFEGWDLLERGMENKSVIRGQLTVNHN